LSEQIDAYEAKLRLAFVMKRAVWSVFFGVLLWGICVVYFGPRASLIYGAKYAAAILWLDVRKLPILGVRTEDIHAAAKYWSLMHSRGTDFGLLAWILLGAIVAVFLILTLVHEVKWNKTRLDRFQRGNSLVPVEIHNKLIGKKYGPKPPHHMGQVLKLGREKVLIPESLQYRHLAFLGASGYGKSTAIEEILYHAQEKGQKCIIVDLNGAYWSKFGRVQDRILSLHDARSASWTLWSEPLLHPENLAAALIEAEGSSHAYFWKGARALLASLLRLNRDVKGLMEDLNRPIPELREKLLKAGEISVRVLGDSASEQADGIIGTTALDFAFLRDLRHLEPKNPEDGFSLSRWILDDEEVSWVFLTVREIDLEQTRPLLRLWFDVACLAVLQRHPDDKRSPHLWLVVDELKSVGQLPSLPGILDKGRKYKASMVLGFQALSQLKKIYGEHDAASIVQGLQNQFFFRMTEVDCAEYASKVIGCEDVEQASFAVSFGEKKDKDRGSINHARTQRRLVMPDEIRSLDILEAYAKLCHHNPLKMTFKPSARTSVHEGFIERPSCEPQECPSDGANLGTSPTTIEEALEEISPGLPGLTSRPTRTTAQALFGMEE
jgi:hypothetical protein